MRRRDFLRTTAVSSLGVLGAGVSASARPASAGQNAGKKRPNVLFCLADDWGWPHAGAYGDPVVKTPSFDRLAKEGVLFTNAYISSPSCTPSRNAVLSGQYHWRLDTGASLYGSLDPATPVYPLLLKQAGYAVGSWRKSWGPGSLKAWKDHPAGTPIRKGFDAFLDAKPKDAPFCFFFGTSDPHRGYRKGSGAASGMDISKIKLFDCFPDSPEVRGDVADYYYEVQRWDSDVGKAIAKLEKIGELENTIIVMTGDHGMPFPRCKGNLYDSGSRVPLAIRWGANIAKPGRTVHDFVSFCDLAPTYLQAAGVEIPKVMTGKSLLSILTSDKEGIVEPKRREFVMYGKERHCPGQEGHMGGYPCRAIRLHGYLYIRNFKPDRWPAGTPNWEKAAIRGAWLADCDNVVHYPEQGQRRRTQTLLGPLLRQAARRGAVRLQEGPRTVEQRSRGSQIRRDQEEVVGQTHGEPQAHRRSASNRRRRQVRQIPLHRRRTETPQCRKTPKEEVASATAWVVLVSGRRSGRRQLLLLGLLLEKLPEHRLDHTNLSLE